MRSERALGTLGRVLRRFSFVGIAAGIAVGALWNGCAGSNTDYNGNIVDGGDNGDGPPPGSDLTCQKTPDPDVPDSNFVDNNCDGIDGDATQAIFASPNGDDTFAGTRETPVKTIAQALKLAQQKGLPGVYLDKGIYSGSVTMVAGIGIYGGYDSGNLWSRSAANDTQIVGGTTAITGSGINKETHIELVSVKSADGTSPGQSSYGVFVANSSGPIILGQLKVNAGNATTGAVGAAGTAGSNGQTPAAAGVNGCTNSCGACNNQGLGGKGAASACSADGGDGGNGGCDANNGSAGIQGKGSAPGGGGGGGSYASCPLGSSSAGGQGKDGSPGTDGTLGAQAAASGTMTAAGYLPAAGGDGVAGTNGSGGGGGGGGGGGSSGFLNACNGDKGGGGGGGGSGGCAATAAKGGGGGGGSFGVFVFSSTVTINGGTIASGRADDGGKGGNGASGGTSGPGAAAGAGSNDASGGGRGGNGGVGGNSGAGAGGTGGPSYGIYAKGSQVTTNGVQASAGAFGVGGNGGSATLGAKAVQAPAGSPGKAGPQLFE